MVKKAERLMKAIGKELAIEASLEVARGYLLERLKHVTPDDLYDAIMNGTHTLNVSEDKDKKFGRKMAKKFSKIMYKGRKAQEYLTPELVLEWLKEDLPHLASLIINMGDKGMKWLEKDVEKIHKFLWPSSET